MSEHVPGLVLWPDEQDAGDHGRYEVVKPPPALNPGPIDFEDALTNRQRAVIPYQEEQQY